MFWVIFNHSPVRPGSTASIKKNLVNGGSNELLTWRTPPMAGGRMRLETEGEVHGHRHQWLSVKPFTLQWLRTCLFSQGLQSVLSTDTWTHSVVTVADRTLCLFGCQLLASQLPLLGWTGPHHCLRLSCRHQHQRQQQKQQPVFFL